MDGLLQRYARVHPNTQVHQIRNDLNTDYSYRNANQKGYEKGTLLTKIYKLAQVVSYSR